MPLAAVPSQAAAWVLSCIYLAHHELESVMLVYHYIIIKQAAALHLTCYMSVLVHLSQSKSSAAQHSCMLAAVRL